MSGLIQRTGLSLFARALYGAKPHEAVLVETSS
jgi:hypothetical protein